MGLQQLQTSDTDTFGSVSELCRQVLANRAIFDAAIAMIGK